MRYSIRNRPNALGTGIVNSWSPYPRAMAAATSGLRLGTSLRGITGTLSPQ
jgi:hypothetical protein